jgi:hypothetical protein
MLLAQGLLPEYQCVSPIESTCPYFTLLLLKVSLCTAHAQHIHVKRVPFRDSHMGRDLLMVSLPVSLVMGASGRSSAEVGGGHTLTHSHTPPRILIATSHLESTWREHETRAKQAAQACGVFEDYENVLFVGE